MAALFGHQWKELASAWLTGSHAAPAQWPAECQAATMHIIGLSLSLTARRSVSTLVVVTPAGTLLAVVKPEGGGAAPPTARSAAVAMPALLT